MENKVLRLSINENPLKTPETRQIIPETVTLFANNTSAKQLGISFSCKNIFTSWKK